jgi:hypothetical protein
VKKLQAPLALLLPILGAVAAPASAGTVFVPLASNTSIQGANYVTKVWVTNPDTVTHHFTTAFIQEGTDGTTAPSSGNIFATPSGTTVLAGVAPQGQTGLLAVNSATTLLLVGARMEVTDANGNLVGIASLPTITQQTAAAAGGMLEVQGLQRAATGTITDYSLVNLGSAAAQCTVAAFASTGGLLAAPATLAVTTFSRRDFPDVLSAVGESAASDARILATCNQPFYAFATVYTPGGPSITVVGPSTDLSGTIGPPLAAGGGGSGGNGAGDVTFDVPGTFLTATQTDSEQLYTLPATVGVAYKKATIDFDLHIGNFPVGLFTGVMAFRRPSNQRALREPFCAIQIVNRNSKTILDLGIENDFARTQGPWKSNSSYHLTLTYDLTIRQCQLQVSSGGSVIYTIAGPAQWLDMSANSNPLELDFGQTGIGDGAYYPPITWSYANLSVVLEPQ